MKRWAAWLLVLGDASPANAGPWLQEPGGIQAGLGIGYWAAGGKLPGRDDRGRADRCPAHRNGDPARPAEPGDRIDFSPDTCGALEAFEVRLDGAVGVARWLEAQVSVPLQRVSFETINAGEVQPRTGLGDVRVALQQGLKGERVAVAIRQELKLPTGESLSRRDRVIFVPLSEGQADLALQGHIGVSLWPYGYAAAAGGYRVRTRNDDLGLDPGDEWDLRVDLGARILEWLTLHLAGDALLGTASIDAFGLPRSPRRFFSVWTGLHVAAGARVSVRADVRFALAGQAYPAGTQVFLGLSWQVRP